MSAQRNKVNHVTTIARVAIELGETEDWLSELAEEMDTEDGLIWVYGPGDEGVMAFSDDGVECLRELISIHKENPEINRDSSLAVYAGWIRRERSCPVSGWPDARNGGLYRC